MRRSRLSAASWLRLSSSLPRSKTTTAASIATATTTATTAQLVSACGWTSARFCSAATTQEADLVTTAETSVSAASSASASGGGALDTQQRRGKWCDEPTLDDLDLSIPQVNCAFVADLIAKRRREQRRQWGEIVERKKEKAAAVAAAAGEKTAAAAAAASEEKTAAAEDDDDDELGMEEDEEMVDLAMHPSDGILLLDVRSVAEIEVWGTIEGAKVVPMHEFWEAFHLSPEDFFDQYGFLKPEKDTTVLFFCQHGPRSLMGAQILHHLGWPNVLHLRQGFFEWSKQYYLMCRRWMVHDYETGNNDRRLVEFEATKAIAEDIAPEFNELIEAETELIRIDHSRSHGTKELPMPEPVLQLSAKFEEERDRIETGAGGNIKAALEGERVAQKRLLDDAHTRSLELEEAQNINAPAAKDVVLSSQPTNIDDLEMHEQAIRRDYMSETAKVLRRKKASERTGIPDSYMFRRKEMPHGTGR